MDQKHHLRRGINKCLARLSESEKSRQSQQVCEQVISLLENEGYETVMCYAALDDEVNVDAVIERCWEQGKTVLLPKVISENEQIAVAVSSRDELAPDQYGIRAPVSTYVWQDGIDLIVVPGRAFDLQGNRVGRGKGYYDRFLAEHVAVETVGVCFSEQVVKAVPLNEWDQKMTNVLSGQ